MRFSDQETIKAVLWEIVPIDVNATSMTIDLNKIRNDIKTEKMKEAVRQQIRDRAVAEALKSINDPNVDKITVDLSDIQ